MVKYIKDSSGNIVYLRGVCKGDFLVDATGYFSVTSGVGVWSDSGMRADETKWLPTASNLSV